MTLAMNTDPDDDLLSPGDLIPLVGTLSLNHIATFDQSGAFNRTKGSCRTQEAEVVPR
jgi:hypothetical protein